MGFDFIWLLASDYRKHSVSAILLSIFWFLSVIGQWLQQPLFVSYFTGWVLVSFGNRPVITANTLCQIFYWVYFGLIWYLSSDYSRHYVSVCWSGLHAPIAYSLLGGGVPIPEQRLCGTLYSVPLRSKVTTCCTRLSSPPDGVQRVS